MKSFGYTRVERTADALAALDQPGAQAIAGGTNLTDLLRLDVVRPDLLVDIDRLDLGSVEVRRDGSLLVGANVRGADLAAHPVVRSRFPVLARALLAAASAQLRNRASTGGNLLQRTRCVYFMDATKPCNKREPGSGCPAIEGVSRELAILGGSSQCIATHPGDMAVALMALDALVHVEGPDGAQTMALDDFYRLPEHQPDKDTNLPPGSIITAVEIPPLSFSQHSTYRKARDRQSFAFGLVTVAAALDLDDGRVRDVRLSLGAVAHKPWRAWAAENALRGGPATAEAFRAAIDAELADAEPTQENAFKVELARRLVVGTLLELAEARS